MAQIKAIVLNAEQTKRFLSFFVPEAIQLANKRIAENEMLEKGSQKIKITDEE